MSITHEQLQRALDEIKRHRTRPGVSGFYCDCGANVPTMGILEHQLAAAIGAAIGDTRDS